MMKVALVSACALSCASAFVAPNQPSLLSKSRTAASASASLDSFPEDLKGFDFNPGFAKKGVAWDPLNLAGRFPQYLPFFQEAEIKHGRVCMLATVGCLATALGIALPGRTGISVVEAHDKMVAEGVMTQLFGWIGLLEMLTFRTCLDMDKKDRAPGDFSFDPLKLGKEDMTKMKVREIKNGRLAMLAFSGMITQAALSSKGSFL